ncbi:MAG: alpha/beta hydrolase fold domain-containing protein [Sphingomonadales bacterium]|nr:alpha/beta hydrolase fold domain-containing protein [Sphingomonadales bacterium]
MRKAAWSAVLSVAYRLAPEHRCPPTVKDCFEAWFGLPRTVRHLASIPSFPVCGDGAAVETRRRCCHPVLVDRRATCAQPQLLIYPVHKGPGLL